eukprot:scaffold827_cov36-Phaeocystis_antarctica.AAC.3
MRARYTSVRLAPCVSISNSRDIAGASSNPHAIAMASSGAACTSSSRPSSQLGEEASCGTCRHHGQKREGWMGWVGGGGQTSWQSAQRPHRRAWSIALGSNIASGDPSRSMRWRRCCSAGPGDGLSSSARLCGRTSCLRLWSAADIASTPRRWLNAVPLRQLSSRRLGGIWSGPETRSVMAMLARVLSVTTRALIVARDRLARGCRTRPTPRMK